jgi:hypothetical protein
MEKRLSGVDGVEFREIRGRGDLWVDEICHRYDRGPTNRGVSIVEFRGRKIAPESSTPGRAWDAPECARNGRRPDGVGSIACWDRDR